MVYTVETWGSSVTCNALFVLFFSPVQRKQAVLEDWWLSDMCQDWLVS